MLPAAILPYALRCESLTEPLGVGRARPALSWKLKATDPNARNLRQAAYQVRVGTTPGRADLWNSGRVVSSEQGGVEYAGKPLQSGQVVYWSVRAWDGRDAPSGWSQPARFSVGLLRERDWTGRWIAFDPPEPTRRPPFEGALWIGSAEDPQENAPAATRTYVRTFGLEGVASQAQILLTADDRFTLRVNGREMARSPSVLDAWRTPVRVEIGPALRDGENRIEIEATNNAPGPAGVLAVLTVGKQRIVTDAAWTCDGRPVREIAPYGAGPWGGFADGKTLRPATLYRKEFAVPKAVRRATATVTALGLVDLTVNGQRVAPDFFTPGWTDYKRRVYARTYDVTARVRQGANRIEAEVGDGWYSGYVGYGGKRAHYGDRPRLRAQIVIEYTDGTRRTVGTDGTWRATPSPTHVQDLLWGEERDERITLRWGTAREVAVSTPVEPAPGPPVRPYARLRPVAIAPTRDGYRLDFGQNLAGAVHLRLQGRPGQTLELRHAEVLNPDGSLYRANLRGARAVDRFTFGAAGTADWTPRFTFHGFRYVEVVGLGRRPRPEEFTAVALSSATPETGTFRCSDPMLNRLAANAWWTQKMNFIDVPTDCPQRDERLGWTGDAQVYVRTAATYSDVQTFFRKWLVDLDDAQRADGQYPMVAPLIVAEGDGGPAWADAGVICPWTIYEVYGDRRLLREHYPQMRRFVEFTRARSTPALLPPPRFHAFGDWLSVGANTTPEVIYQAYFAYSANLLARSARALGYAEDAARYERLFADVKAAFNRAYVTVDGVVATDTQTAYVLALSFDLLDEPIRGLAADRLIADIEKRDGHLSTGFVGTRDLLPALMKIGREDVAFRLLHQDTYPSWLFPIRHGATTIWERWDGWTPERGYQDPGMNSFAHYAYGAVMGWVFAHVGGIDQAEPGFARIRIAPKFDPNLAWASTTFESIRGPVRTNWRRTDDGLLLSVQIPPNTTAEIQLPGGFRRTVGSGWYRYRLPEVR